MNEPEMILSELKVRRVGRTVMYSCLVASGIVASFFPADLITDQVTHRVSVAWSVCMIVSSCICLFGSITDKWIGEYSGLPLLSAVLMMYGFSIMLASSKPDASITLLAYGFVVTGFSCGLISRWMDVRVIRTANSHHKRGV